MNLIEGKLIRGEDSGETLYYLTQKLRSFPINNENDSVVSYDCLLPEGPWQVKKNYK